MKPTHSFSMHKLQKSLPISSLVWAAIVTAIVLALAASASAQEDDAVTTNAAGSAASEVRPLPATTSPRPAANATTTTNIGPAGPKPLPVNAAVTSSNTAAVQAPAVGVTADRLAEFAEKRQAVLEKVKARRLEITEKRALIASSTAARRALLKEEAQKRIIGRAGKLTGVVENAISRLENMSTRLRDHANKLATQSVDVTATIALLDEADGLLNSAKEALQGIDTNISYAALSATPKQDWSDAKEQFMEVRTLLEDARVLLREALLSLKALSVITPVPEEIQSTN